VPLDLAWNLKGSARPESRTDWNGGIVLKEKKPGCREVPDPRSFSAANGVRMYWKKERIGENNKARTKILATKKRENRGLTSL